MLGINQITQEVNKKAKQNSEVVKKVLTAFLEVAKQKLNEGESINFKGYFTIKRSTTKPKGSKYCGRHERTITDYKKANKGKGIAVFAKSDKFKKLVAETRNCKDCSKRKVELAKSVKLVNRVNFKVGEGF